MIRRPPRSTRKESSAASDVYKRQVHGQPYKGGKKRGVKGFAKGVFFGIVGAVVKPVSGALDLVARTAEGGKNTTCMFDEDLDVRARNPRPIYTNLQVVCSSPHF
eukprot:TRINITY_DN5260_c0_g1_i5.p1 TRINITY_DN5260_c0_g1~~TRINITY_DN5260_c0_g1_i5.p1  ORF type:complete len:113 (+),score=49.11 TRINITY_DN5260_c0_g1_i5:25-339(+)